MKKQEGFNVEVGIWTKEGVLRPIDYPFNKESKEYNEYNLYVFLGGAIEGIKLSVQVIVHMDPFTQGCSFGFTEISQLDSIKFSQFEQPIRAFLMFDGKKDALECVDTEKIQKEFLSQLQRFLQRVSELEFKEADRLGKATEEFDKKVSGFEFGEVIKKCRQRASSIIALRASIFN